jgi:penicillin-binding protein 2
MFVVDQLNKSDPPLRLLTWTVLAGMLVLLGGLWCVQVISARRYQENLKSQAFRTVRMPAVRGKILDRHGTPLAENRPSYNVSLYLDELRDRFVFEYTNNVLKDFKRANPNLKAGLPRSVRTELQRRARYQVVSNLVAQLGAQLEMPLAIDTANFQRHYTNQLALPLVVAKLDQTNVARFQEQSMSVPGVDLHVQPLRVYPFGTLAAQTLGYLQRDDSSVEDEEAFFNFRLPDYKGALGIEKGFNLQLGGKAGVKSVLVNSGGYRQAETEWAPAEPGHNIVLTLALPIQKAAEKALATSMHGTNTRGAIVVMEVNTGDILAIASSPSFDPNQFLPHITPELMERLNDPQLQPAFNRATLGSYAPGSIFKIITGLAALEGGVLDPNEIYRSPGYYQLGNRRIKDLANGGQPSEFDFKRAFKLSSNAYFVNYGLRTGEEPILNLGKHLHLGERTGILSKQETSGTLPTKEWLKKNAYPWREGDTANLAIGQGYLVVTPIQMACMVAAVANGGKVFWPRLVARIQPQQLIDSESAQTFPAGQLRDRLPVSQKNLQIVRDAMLADVEEEGGTGRGAGVSGMRVCGKTGTAQITNERNVVVDHKTWFASFAPYESPRYSVIVMVESGASGGTTCAPIARQIYSALQKWETTTQTETLATN